MENWKFSVSSLYSTDPGGGFYASQDADISLDDDGDYFTWTKAEAEAVLSEDEARIAGLHYDINEVGEMHHNPAKNVLYQRAPLSQISTRLKISEEQVNELLRSARQKMYAARLQRPTPYIDKTIYVNWNSLCVSAYLRAASVLSLDEARKFALRSLDRILAEAWNSETGLKHVVAYSDVKMRETVGFLEDYAATAADAGDAPRPLPGSRPASPLLLRFSLAPPNGACIARARGRSLLRSARFV
jgi:hypothetical protein